MESEIRRYAVIGGDLRQAYLAEAAARDGDFVYAAAFEGYPFPGIVRKTGIEDAIAQATHIILPLPVSRDGKTLNAPYSAHSIPMDDALAQKMAGKRVFAGMAERLPATKAWQALTVADYFSREEVMLKNAALTAEGAVSLAMAELPVSLHGLRCLVAGCGRIGKSLSQKLRDLGAVVAVSARREEQLAWIELERMRAVRSERIHESGEYELIFNTVPGLLFDARTLEFAAQNALLIELASAPYGVDFAAAKRLNIPVLLAEGLPGRYAPKTAGIILQQAIKRMAEE